MKNIKIIVVLILLVNYTNEMLGNNKIPNNITFNNLESATLAEQVYNKLNVSTAIVEFTNNYIDSKKEENKGISNSVWNKIKNNIDYNFFKSEVVNILNKNLSNSQLQKLINDFSNRPVIPIPTLKIKKEIGELINSFNDSVDQTIASFI